MSEAVLILPNMRGGCVTVGNKVHTLFRLAPRRGAAAATLAQSAASRPTGAAGGEPHEPRRAPEA